MPTPRSRDKDGATASTVLHQCKYLELYSSVVHPICRVIFIVVLLLQLPSYCRRTSDPGSQSRLVPYEVPGIHSGCTFYSLCFTLQSQLTICSGTTEFKEQIYWEALQYSSRSTHTPTATTTCIYRMHSRKQTARLNVRGISHLYLPAVAVPELS